MHIRNLDRKRLGWDVLSITRNFFLNHHIFEVDFSTVDIIRKRLEKQLGKRPSYVTCTCFAIGRTLTQYPDLNSYLQTFPTTRLALYHDVDIALTVERIAYEVPYVFVEVLQGANKRSFLDTMGFFEDLRNRSFTDYQLRSVSNIFVHVPTILRRAIYWLYLAPSPLRMRQLFGTCAFTSVGKFGTSMTTPLSPRTVTFSLGAIRKRPVVRGDEVIPANTGYLTITYDHRVSDGGQVARLGSDLRMFLEDFDPQI